MNQSSVGFLDPYAAGILAGTVAEETPSISALRETVRGNLDEVLGEKYSRDGRVKIFGEKSGKEVWIFLHENPGKVRNLAKLQEKISAVCSQLVAELADGTMKAQILWVSMARGLVFELPAGAKNIEAGKLEHSRARQEKYRVDLDEALAWSGIGVPWISGILGENSRVGAWVVDVLQKRKIRGWVMDSLKKNGPVLAEKLENFSVEKIKKKFLKMLREAKFGQEFSLGGVAAGRAVEVGEDLVFGDLTGAGRQPRGWDAVSGEFRDFLRAVPTGEKAFAGWQSMFWKWLEFLGSDLRVLVFAQMVLVLAELRGDEKKMQKFWAHFWEEFRNWEGFLK